jgi:hypothetical protein
LSFQKNGTLKTKKMRQTRELGPLYNRKLENGLCNPDFGAIPGAIYGAKVGAKVGATIFILSIHTLIQTLNSN